MNRFGRRSAPFWHRAFAGLGVMLVLALAVFGASAELHRSLHECDHDQTLPAAEADGCAVVQFAGGTTVPLEVPLLVDAPSERVEAVLGPVTRVAGGAVDFRLPPGQAPPRA